MGIGTGAGAASREYALLDVDDTIVEVHGYAKQGAGFGYTRVRGLNAVLATLMTSSSVPVIVAQRLRKGAAYSARGAKRLVADAVKQAHRLLALHDPAALVLVRMDSAYYGRGAIWAALAGGAQVSVTVRMNAQIKTAIAAIDPDVWTPIEYTDAIFDEESQTWVSRAEVAEVPFTAFASGKKSERVPGRLVVRRIPDLNAGKKKAAGGDGSTQGALFEVWRFHAFFTTADPEILDTVTADKTHRHHAVIEQIHADLKNSALAHLPSGVFNANAARLVLAVIAFNLTRAAGTVAAPDLARATTATIRRKLIAVPARVASSARRITLHLPTSWPWQGAWTELFDRAFDRVSDPPRQSSRPDHPAANAARPRIPWNNRTARSGARACHPHLKTWRPRSGERHRDDRWIQAKAAP